MAATTFNERWARTFEQAVKVEQESLKNTLAAGNVPDHAEYKRIAGKIAGLQSALSLLEQTLIDIQKS